MQCIQYPLARPSRDQCGHGWMAVTTAWDATVPRAAGAAAPLIGARSDLAIVAVRYITYDLQGRVRQRRRTTRRCGTGRCRSRRAGGECARKLRTVRSGSGLAVSAGASGRHQCAAGPCQTVSVDSRPRAVTVRARMLIHGAAARRDAVRCPPRGGESMQSARLMARWGPRLRLVVVVGGPEGEIVAQELHD